MRARRRARLCAREADTGRIDGSVGESTWLTFTITPGGATLDFSSGGVATVDTYAYCDLVNSATSGTFELYWSNDGGSSWTSLGSLAGASISSGAGNAGAAVG